MGKILTDKTAAQKSPWIKNFKKNYSLLFFVLPAFLTIIIFAYVPMYGILVAFQRGYTPGDPIIADFTQWVGFGNFTAFFKEYRFGTLMTNTFLLCFFGFIAGFPLPVAVALMLNAMRKKRVSGALQTLFYAPHFISLVVMAGMLFIFFGRFGLINNVRDSMGIERVSYFLDPKVFRPMYILSGVWQEFGWSAIIYLAALSGVDMEIDEAAVIDGASRFQRVIHIDYPAIKNTVSVVLILSIGGLMSAGHEKALLLQTAANLPASEIIATFVYKKGLTGLSDPGYATAVGLFNSVVNVILLVVANYTAKSFSKNSLW